MEIQKGEDEELIPKDVSPIGLAVKTSRRHSDIHVDGVFRDRLEQVEDMQVQRS